VYYFFFPKASSKIISFVLWVIFRITHFGVREKEERNTDNFDNKILTYLWTPKKEKYNNYQKNSYVKYKGGGCGYSAMGLKVYS